MTYTLRYRPVGSDGAWMVVPGIEDTQYTLTGLEPGTQYDVEVVRVVNEVESSAATGRRFTKTQAPAQPAAESVLAETLTLSWLEVTGATEYRVFRSGSPDAIATVAAPTTEVALSGLAPGVAYSFTVVAVNADDDVSAASDARAATTSALASGGAVADITVGGVAYRVHTFTATGASTFTLNATRDLEYLVVGGGASGTRGQCNVYWGHGGGGGGVSTGTLAATPGEFGIEVGAGGGGASQSCFDAHTGASGGASRLRQTPGGTVLVEASGGSGAAWNQAVGGASGAGVVNGVSYTGRAGGTGVGQFGAGGGGGAGGAGSGITGGVGVESAITGSTVMYGAGGAGRNSGGFGTASSGGGSGGAGVNGRGGGGSDSNSPGQYTAGGSGVVVVRYRVNPTA